MDVYLIPTRAPGQYELYYEAPDVAMTEDDGDERGLLNRLTFGWSTRLKRRFNEMLLEAEEWRRRRHERRPEPAGVMGRLRRRLMGFIVERIAEQRLLWHLRRADALCACIPADLPEDESAQIIRAMLLRDLARHRKWLLIDLALLLPSVALTVVPGPNILGLYFTFQVVSHYLSWTGAKRGLALEPWTFNTSADLSALRDALCLAPPHRQRRFHEVAARLRLEHLPTFLEEVAARPA